MKKLIKKGLLSVLLLAAVAVNASNKLNIKIASGNSKMLSISLSGVILGETVYIEDYRGEVLFSENLEVADTYARIFNLSSLPEGLYFIGSKDSNKIHITPIVVSTDNVALLEKSSKMYLAPELIIEDNVLRVLVQNQHKSLVSIEVYNEGGTMLSSTESNSNSLVYGSYDISNLDTETITISVTEGEQNFTKEFKL